MRETLVCFRSKVLGFWILYTLLWSKATKYQFSFKQLRNMSKMKCPRILAATITPHWGLRESFNNGVFKSCDLPKWSKVDRVNLINGALQWFLCCKACILFLRTATCWRLPLSHLRVSKNPPHLWSFKSLWQLTTSASRMSFKTNVMLFMSTVYNTHIWSTIPKLFQPFIERCSWKLLGTLERCWNVLRSHKNLQKWH